MSSFYDLASLVMIPSGKKAGKVYSQKPLTTDGQLNLIRASTATRIGSDGKIEKTRTNLNLYSDPTDAQKGSLSYASVTYQDNFTWGIGNSLSNAIVFGDNTTTRYAYYNSSVSSGTVYSLSFFIKMDDNSVPVPATDFILVLGGLSISSGYSVVSLGNNVHRVSAFAVATASNTANGILKIGSHSAKSFKISGFQVETSLVATDYIPTNGAAVSVGSVDNMPRLNYTEGSATSCPSLLLEPQRTNILPQSEYFSGSDWTKSNATTINNIVISPDSALNGSKLIEDSSNSTHRISDTIVVSGSGVVYTQSIFAKSGGNGRYLRIFRGSGTYNFAVFDLENGTVFAQGGSNIISTKIENYGNGWYRCSSTYTTQFSNIGTYYGLQNGSSDSYTGDGSSFIYIYGAQLEEGSYATSYIPTFGATVTRVNETLSLSNMQSGVANGATSGTLLVDFEYIFDSLGDSMRFYQSTSISNRAYIYFKSIGYADTWGSSNLPLTDNVPTKVIYRLNSLSSGSGFRNGTKGTDQTGTAWADIGNLIFYSNYATIKIKKILFFPTALTDAQCIELTTIDS